MSGRVGWGRGLQSLGVSDSDSGFDSATWSLLSHVAVTVMLLVTVPSTSKRRQRYGIAPSCGVLNCNVW